MELNFGLSGRPSPYPGAGAGAGPGLGGLGVGVMGPPTPVTPSTPNSALSSGAPRLDPAKPLDTAATLLHSLRALINHVYAPTLPAATPVYPPKSSAAAAAAAAAAAGDSGSDGDSASAVAVAAAASGSDLTRFHALSASLAQHCWERSFVEFDDRLSALQRHVHAAEEKLTAAANAAPPASASLAIAPVTAQAAAAAALKKYVFFSERASNAQQRLMGVSGACHRSVALIDSYRAKRAAQQQQQLQQRKAALPGANGNTASTTAAAADETIDEVAAVLEMIRALQHAKHSAQSGAAASAADSKADPSAVPHPANGTAAGAGAFVSVNAALLATGAVPPLTSISTAACGNGSNGIGSGGGGANSTAANVAAGSHAVLDELEIIADGDADAANKPSGDLSIMFGSSAKAETLILDVKMRFHTTTTTAPAVTTAAGAGDKRGAAAMDTGDSGGGKRLRTADGSAAAANGSAGSSNGSGGATVTTTRRQIAVESVAASIMMGQNTGQPRDYTHPQMDDDVRQLFLTCARGATAQPTATAARSAAPAMSAVSALAAARLLHKLLRIREKEKCMDRHTGMSGGLDAMALHSSVSAPASSGAADRLRRMFGEVEVTLDAFASVPLTRCRRVLEGLACVYLELPATSCSAALLPYADSAPVAAFLTAAKVAAAAAASAAAPSTPTPGGLSFALTYVGPFEHVWAPMPSATAHGSGTGAPPSPTHDLALDTERQATFSYAFEVNSSISSAADPPVDPTDPHASAVAPGVLFPAPVAAAVARLCALPATATPADVEAAAAPAFAPPTPTASRVSSPAAAAVAAANEQRDRELCARGASFCSALMPTMAIAAASAATSASASASAAAAGAFVPHHTAWVLDQTHAFRLITARVDAAAANGTAPNGDGNGHGSSDSGSGSVWLRERGLRVSQVLVAAMPAVSHATASLAATGFGRALGLFRAQVLFNRLLSTCFAPSTASASATGSTTARLMVTAAANGSAAARRCDWTVRVPSAHVLLLTPHIGSGVGSSAGFRVRISVAAELMAWPVVALEALPSISGPPAAPTAPLSALNRAAAYATSVLRTSLHVPLMLAYTRRALKLV